MTITQLLEMPTGVDNRTGGFQLTVKVARKTVEIDKKHLQWVVFMDETGEMPGEVSLPKYIPLKKYQRIHITVCWLQPGENGKKLYVDQWYPITCSSDEGISAYEAHYHSDWGSPDTSEAMEWQAVRREEIKGKCRHGVSCAYIRGLKSGFVSPTKTIKKIINEWVDFIVTGE